MKSDRARGLALVASTALIVVFFALHPQFEDPADNAAVFQAIVDDGFSFRVAQVARILAWMLILAGATLIERPLGVAGTLLLALGAAFQLAHAGFEVTLQLVLGPWLAAAGPDADAWLRIATSLRNADAGTIALSLLTSGAGLAVLGVDEARRSPILGGGQAVLAGIVALSGVAFALSLDFRAMMPAFLASLALHGWLGMAGMWTIRVPIKPGGAAAPRGTRK